MEPPKCRTSLSPKQSNVLDMSWVVHVDSFDLSSGIELYLSWKDIMALKGVMTPVL